MQKQLTTGVQLTAKRTQRWQTNILTCHFVGPAVGTSNTALTLLARILAHGCQLYPKNDQLSLALAQLYGANLQVEHQVLGNWHDLYLEMSYVDPDKNGEIGQQCFRLLQQLVFEPLFEVAHFGAQAFALEYQALKNELTDLQNDHDFQAFTLTKSAFFTTQNTQQPTIGSLGELAEINYQNLRALYQQILANWRVEIVASGQFLPDDETLTNWPFKQRSVALPEVAVDQVDQSFQSIKREVVGQQTHLVLAYQLPDLVNTDNHQRDVLRLLGAYLGGDEQSQLFQKVREQAGLAYDISLNEDILLGWLVIEAGVARTKATEAVQAIHQVIQAAIEQIEPQLMKAEINTLLNRQLRSLDNSRFLQAQLFRNVLFPERQRTFEEIKTSLTNVTTKELQQLAAQLTLKVVTIVENKAV